MPLHIVRRDITKIECDAIVNATNRSLLGQSGVDGAIHNAAGEELEKECEMLGGCSVGEAKVTSGYKLPCKYIIHTVGPVWKGGSNGEEILLVSCYKNSLKMAKEKGCESVAFPLISTGFYSYPKEQALQVAVKTIREFLDENEMTIYLVVYDKSSYDISKTLFYNVKEYLEDNFKEERFERRLEHRRFEFASKSKCASRERDSFMQYDCCMECKSISTLEDMLDKIDDTFSVTLLKLIDEKGMSDIECYKKANVSKQTWYKIMNEKSYKPSKNTVIAFAIALQLTLDETKKLLETVGFTLSRSSKFDIIIEYFLINKEYDIFTINETLFKFDQICLGV